MSKFWKSRAAATAVVLSVALTAGTAHADDPPPLSTASADDTPPHAGTAST